MQLRQKSLHTKTLVLQPRTARKYISPDCVPSQPTPDVLTVCAGVAADYCGRMSHIPRPVGTNPASVVAGNPVQQLPIMARCHLPLRCIRPQHDSNSCWYQLAERCTCKARSSCWQSKKCGRLQLPICPMVSAGPLRALPAAAVCSMRRRRQPVLRQHPVCQEMCAVHLRPRRLHPRPSIAAAALAVGGAAKRPSQQHSGFAASALLHPPSVAASPSKACYLPQQCAPASCLISAAGSCCGCCPFRTAPADLLRLPPAAAVPSFLAGRRPSHTASTPARRRRSCCRC